MWTRGTAGWLGVLTVLSIGAPVGHTKTFDFDDFWQEPSVAEVPFDEVELDSGEDDGLRWRQFVYTSMRHGDDPVRVFAVYAEPLDLDPEAPRPALVVTHGLFGRAALDGIRPYVQAGYPSVMWEWEIRYRRDNIAVPGDGLVSLPHTYYPESLYPERQYPRADPEDWKRTIWYPAMLAGRRAVTWLQGRPGVDPDRIGATGGSYGGQSVSLLTTIEPRIRAVVPTSFSPLALQSPSGLLSLPNLTLEEKQAYAARFDAAENLHRTQAAFLWQVGTHDRPFFPPTIHETLARTSEPRALWLLPNIDHIHPAPETVIRWFETHLGEAPAFPDPGVPVARMTSDAVEVEVRPRADVPLTHVTVYWSDNVPSEDYTGVLWRATPAWQDEDETVWRAAIKPPFGGTGEGINLFVQVRDARGAIVSSSPLVAVALGDYAPVLAAPIDVAAEGTIRLLKLDTADLDTVATWPAEVWTPPFTLQFITGQSAAKPAPRSHTLGDMDARFAAGWTADFLVFGLVVQSPFPLINAAPEKPFWHGDSFQIRLYGGPGARDGKRPGSDDVVLHVNGWRGADGAPVMQGQRVPTGQPWETIASWGDSALRFHEREDGRGWNAAARIPWSVLGLNPAPDLSLRMGIQVNIGNEVGDMSLGYCEFNHGQNFGTPQLWGRAELYEQGWPAAR